MPAWRAVIVSSSRGRGTAPALWLGDITHSGIDTSAGTTITDPKTVFNGQVLQNRVWVTDGLAPLDRYRITSIKSPTGAVTTIGYSGADCTPTSLPASPQSNTRRCFPQWWTPTTPIVQAPRMDWFHVYPVQAVSADAGPGGPGSLTQTTTYSYLGTPAWRYPELKYRTDTASSKLTWSVLAGWSQVKTITATSAVTTTYLRGLDGTPSNTTGGTVSSTVTASDGTAVTDSPWFSGRTLETQSTLGDGGALLKVTSSFPWASTPTATGATALGTPTARHLGTGRVWSKSAVAAGWRNTNASTGYDSLGRPVWISDQGDTGTTTDDTCTTTAYATGTAANLLHFTAATNTYAGVCNADGTPAGNLLTAGKTTALKLAADTVREAGGRVFGLAPTAVAAAVMGAELGATATTIDSFVLAHSRGANDEKTTPKPGDVIIIDEAGMVGTQLFAAAVTIADQHGAVVRALGDDQQLSAVASGGALRLLKNTVGAVYLEDLHRFRNPDGSPNEAEAAATLALREPPATGVDDPWTFYRENRRVVGGDAETMTSLVFEAWQKDTNDGKHSIMMAFDNATVTELNARAQAYRIATSELDAKAPAAMLRDGLTARAGDIVGTRDNNRRLSTNRGKDFVKNNDVWDVVEAHKDGSLTVKHHGHQGRVTLPAEYVRANTMLGYAATIRRTQGVTCDTTHALISSGLSRSLAYVAASRGRESNKLYGVVADGETLEDVLGYVAANHDSNLTAQEQMDAARAQARSLPDMSAAYRDIDDQANELRMANLAARVLGEGTAAGFTQSTAWGAVATQLRHAENDGFNITNLLTDSVNEGDFDASEDPGAVLAWRVEDRLARWRERAQDTGRRPLESMSDEALERLGQRAVGELMHAKGEASRTPDTEQPDRKTLLRGWLAERKETPWQRRLHGHLSDDDLAARISAATQQLRTDTTINDTAATSKARWLASSLQKEQALRELMNPEVRADEAYERGAVSNYSRDEHASRIQKAALIQRRIHAEIELRRQMPVPVTSEPAPDRLPGWMAPADVVAHQDTPALWRQELAARRELMANEAARLGAQLAAEPPAWAAALGPVPSGPQRQEQWRQLAVEISTYRDTYRVAAAETQPVPTAHQERGVGAELTARVTAMHKYSAQTAKEPLARADAVLMAEAAQVEAIVKESPTPAEHVVDHLQESRGSEAQLSPAQERAERIAALARMVRENRARIGHPVNESRSPEAVKEALEQIKARRAEEQDRRHQTRRNDDQTPRQDRGPGIGR
ncbi:AAA family ATPase [Arthrobacter sp. 2MCAF14]|uniref:AAA family ATPase n=1 Tax=Arthrobacter sp. 2MCAF14 TaxID=3232982 RepID=UPI003F92C38F